MENTQITPRRFGIVFIFLLMAYGLFFNVRTCRLLNRIHTEETLRTFDKQDMKVIENKKNEEIAQQDVIIANKEETLKVITDSIFKLKKKEEVKVKIVTVYVKAKQEVNLQPMVVPYTDTTSFAITDKICDSLKNNSARFILPPKKFDYTDSNLRIVGNVQLHGISIDSFKLKNDISFRVLYQKRGWLRTPVQVVQAINTNPTVSITGMQSVTLKRKNNNWNKWIKPILFGIGGAYIGSKLSK